MSAPSPLRLRPLEIGDLLDETFRMYRRHFVLFAGISVILSIPAAALSGYTYYSFFSTFLQQAGTGQPPNLSSLSTTIGALAVGTLVNVALLPFLYAAVTYAACESALGRPVTAWGVVRGVTRRYFQLLGYVLLAVLMAVLFCLFPLWIWIQVGWVVVMPVMFIENTGLIAAMGRSWRLVEGRWWRTFLIIFLIFILVYVARFALDAFILLGQVLLQIILSSVAASWIFAALSAVIDSVVIPIFQLAVVLIYFDLRVRREALDLFQLAQHVAAPQPTA
ncbi:MAG TPA: hypothetical protein VGU71_12125 [Candidatus Dormibacteraeota bacterium]|nr:hypothetical protein [Candidatus Dormibacteraeota bacterium]